MDLDVNTTIGGISVLDLDLDDIDDVLVTYPDDAEAGLHYGPSNDINSVDLPIDSTLAFSVIDMDGDGDDDVIGGGWRWSGRSWHRRTPVEGNDTESGSCRLHGHSRRWIGWAFGPRARACWSTPIHIRIC